MSYCTGCGQPRRGSAAYCTACGTPFGPPAASASEAAPEPPAPPGPSGPSDRPGSWPSPGEDDDAFGRWFRAGPAEAETVPGRPVPPPASLPHPAGAGRPPGPRRGLTSRQIVMALGVLVLLAAGGTGAWLVLSQPRAGPAPPGAAGRTPATPSGPRAAPSRSPATPSRPPAARHGRKLITVAPAAARQAAAPRVVGFLDAYFTAINAHDYQRYSVLLSPQVRRTETAPVFRAGYRTTTDSAVTLTGISVAAAGQLAADVSFTSRQAPADTPSHTRCTRWRILLLLAPRPRGLALELPPPGYRASYRAC